MPVIKIDITQQSSEVKSRMIEAVTNELSQITQIPIESFRVIINEVKPEDIGIGGKTLKKIRLEAKAHQEDREQK